MAMSEEAMQVDDAPDESSWLRPMVVVAGVQHSSTINDAFASAGPDHWLAAADTMPGVAFEQRLRSELAGLASVSDQSDGRTLIRVSGPRARDALAKGVMIDLHPRAFRPGDAAVSTIGHIGVHFWQLDDLPTYEFVVFRSLAADFWHWLVDAASEFGVKAGRA